MKKLTTLSVVLFCIMTQAIAQIIHVPSDQPTIQAGIGAAGEGDTVVVAENTYYENINFLGKAITVASEFILDGDTSHISKTIIDGSQPSDPNYRSVVTMKTGEDTTSVLSGFTITGGKGNKFNYLGVSVTEGGGVALLFCGGKITDNIIQGNEVIDPNGFKGGGGIGALVYKNHTAVIRNNIIRNNSGSGWSMGGGVHIEGGRIILEYNRIENNTLTGGNDVAVGGGLGFNPTNNDGAIQEMVMRNNLVTGNRVTGPADWGGGGIFIAWPYEVGRLTLSNNIISYNSTSGRGGGVFIFDLARLDFFNNTVLNNKAELDANTLFMGSNCRDILMLNNILWSDENLHLSGIVVEDKPVSVYAYGNILNKDFPLSGSIFSRLTIVCDPAVDTITYAPSADSPAVGRSLDSVKINESWIYPPTIDYTGAFRADISPDEYFDIGAVESPFAKSFPGYNSERIIRIPDEQPTIQAGIDAASDGDTVLVMEGRYYENIDFKGKAITVASAFILDHVEYYIPRTIIDGSQSANPDTASAVMMVSGEDTTSVLMGFTITGGSGTYVNGIHKDYPDWNYFGGAGILIFNSGGKIAHNIIENNHGADPGNKARGFLGCGILATVNHNHTVLIRDNIIRNNTSMDDGAWGGGIGIHGGRAIVENNRILNNTLHTDGLAIGPGFFFENESLEGTIFEAVVRNNIISGNAGYSNNKVACGGGAGINWTKFKLQFYNNVITDNFVEGYGGGLYGYSNIWVACNNTIINNEATVAGNSVLVDVGSILVFYNNIVWSNVDNGLTEFSFWDPNEGSHKAYYNLLKEHFEPGLPVTEIGNIFKEPVFEEGSYRLARNSPGIGAGIDSIKIAGDWYFAPEWDIYGNPRPNPIDTRVDLGAIESPYSVIPVLSIPQESWYQPDFIEATSSKDGWIFLVPEGTVRDLGCIQQACIGNSTSVTAGISAEIPIPETLQNGVYWLYALDMMDNISEPREFNILGVGIDDKGTKNIRIYPNPTNTFLTIETGITDQYQIEIISLNGQVLFAREMEGATHQIDLFSLQKGVYFITIRSKGFVTTRKMIKL